MITAQLVCDDCFNHFKSIKDNSIDAVIADIPFGTTQCKWDSVLNLDLMWDELKRITKDDSPIVLFAQTPFDKVLGCSNLGDLRYEIIWEKPNATGFLNAKKMPLKAHENILVFYKRLPTYNPQMSHGHKRRTSKRKTVNSQCYGKALKLTEYNSTSRYPRSVVKFSSDKQHSNYHPTQKPLELMKYLVKTFTNENQIIIDFTMGSGTTGVACFELNRNFIGIEKDSSYFDSAVKRIRSLNHVRL